MAGMFAAAALARHAQRVTVVEADEIDDRLAHRKGTPQDWQPHVLLDRGRTAVDKLIPGVLEALEDRGAVPFDMGRDVSWFHSGRFKARCRTDHQLSSQSRPLLESTVRDCLSRSYDIEWISGARALAPIARDGRIKGVRVRHRGRPRVLRCDVLIDATGRGSRASQWLESLGLERPEVHEVDMGLGYSTRLYHRQDPWPETPVVMVYDRRPQSTRHGMYLAIEGDRWIVALQGYGGDVPPRDSAGFEAYARSLVRPEIYERIVKSRPLSEIHSFRVPKQRWIRYDQARLPEGLGIVGDAVCAFDPVFGQGMAVAAMEAELLERSIRERRRFDARSFARGCAKIVWNPWFATSTEAFRYPTTKGHRPLGVGLAQRLLDRVYDRAGSDPEVHRAFLRVMQLQAGPASLLRPSVLWRLLRGHDLPMLPLPENHSSSIQLPLGSV